MNNKCSLKKLCWQIDCQVCFKKSFASNKKAHYWSSKNTLLPHQVRKSTEKKFIFDCPCGHDFKAKLSNINCKETWCPYCANRKLCEKEDCKLCFNKSFASSEKAQFWSKKNNLTTRDVLKNSNNNFLFDCKCGHEFESSLNNITYETWCPYCSKPPKKLCDKNDCHQCLNKSFASCEKAIFWSKKNNLTTRQVFKSSKNKYIFDCECGHEFKTLLSGISNGKWCPFCSGHKICERDDCQQCFNKSFASHEKAIFWSIKNTFNPRQVFKSAKNKYIFDCVNGHEFKATLCHVACGRWCPDCKKKTEAKLFAWLTNHFKQFTIIRQKKFDWCRIKQKLSFDFFIKELNWLIELDGNQHFFQISNWTSHDITRGRDILKMNAALKNGLSVIRILQEDVYNDKNDWETKLLESIKKYDIPEVIYIGDSNKYEFHQADMKKLMEEEEIDVQEIVE
jgi:very-short-patch-repair endonuclease